MAELSNFYKLSEAYDLAFSYREIDKEVAFLLSAYEKYAQCMNAPKPRTLLELASGPGKHAMAFAQIGCRPVAIDISPAMCKYGEMIAEKSNLDVRYSPQDMINFRIDEQFDLAIMMLDSICHITRKRDLERHFSCVAKSLTPGGLYIIESSYNVGDNNTTKSDWEIVKGNSKIRTVWRDIKNMSHNRILTEATLIGFMGETEINSTDVFIRRTWNIDDIIRIIRESRLFSLIKIYNDFNVENDSPAKNWRNIFILQRKIA